MTITPALILMAVQATQPATAPPNEEPTMEITRKSEMEASEGSAEYFTGKATISGQFERPAPSNVTGAIVHFEPGARTNWHSHPRGQTLIVTEGVGWTALDGGDTYEFAAGDILWCPADKRHWHGATPTEAMTHIAIQEKDENGKNVQWMEKVSDEEYLRGPPKR